jgi:hypothetical protein
VKTQPQDRHAGAFVKRLWPIDGTGDISKKHSRLSITPDKKEQQSCARIQDTGDQPRNDNNSHIFLLQKY